MSPSPEWGGSSIVPGDYTEAHVRQYFERIGMEVGETLPPATLETLQEIVAKHLLVIPFGNLSLFYYHTLSEPDKAKLRPSDVADPLTTRGFSCHPLDVFQKLVVLMRDGCSGEQNTLLTGILSKLGFISYPVPARTVSHGAEDSAYEVTATSHLVLIVLVGGRRYLVDVGYSQIDSFLPVLIPEPGEQPSEVEILGSKALRITYRHFTGRLEESPLYPAQPLLEARINGRWHPRYFFAVTPSLPSDLDILTSHILHGPSNISHHIMLRLRYQRPDGMLSLFDNVVIFQGDNGTHSSIVLKTEADRRLIYRTKFGIHLHPKDTEHLPAHIANGPTEVPQFLRPHF